MDFSQYRIGLGAWADNVTVVRFRRIMEESPEDLIFLAAMLCK
jgi:hypothetical protein